MKKKTFNSTSILIVDDNIDVLDSMELFLKDEFESVHLLSSPAKIFPLLNKERVDVILLDMNFSAGEQSGQEGIKWLSKILEKDPQAVVVMLTAYANVDLAVKAIKKGATDFIVKPWDNDKLVSTLQAASKLSKSQKEVELLKNQQRELNQQHYSQMDLIWGNAPSMLELRKVVEKIASTDTNVLIYGENGTGKELIAKALHYLSDRSEKTFVKVDMGTINENMFESEMYGHEKGAFTDAKEKRIGRFELANEGTIFLDEISNLPVYLQAKLLSALQNRVITRVGSNQQTPFDVRVITASNKNLEEMVDQNLFRQDLLYRLKTIQLEIPPLRERGEDIILMAHHFLEKYRKKYNKPAMKMNQKAEEALKHHSWPGNIRELEHTIEKAIILNDSSILKAKDFYLKESQGSFNNNWMESEDLDLHQLEKNAILAAIKKNNKNMTHVARELGISRPTLYKKIKQYGIQL